MKRVSCVLSIIVLVVAIMGATQISALAVESEYFVLTISVEETTLMQGENFRASVVLQNISGEDKEISHSFLFWPRISGWHILEEWDVAIDPPYPRTRLIEANGMLRNIDLMGVGCHYDIRGEDCRDDGSCCDESRWIFGHTLEVGNHELRFDARFYLGEFGISEEQHIWSNPIMLTVVPPSEAHGTGWHFDPTEGTLTISTNEGTTAWRTESGNYFHPSSVRNIIINDTVTAIGDEAFSGMSSVSLTSVTIPAGVTSIGDRAFFNSRSLTSLTFQSGTPPSFGNDVFQFSDDITHIIVPYVAVSSFQNVPQLSGFIISHFGIIPDSGVSNIATYVVALFAFIGISLLGIYMLCRRAKVNHA